MSTSSTAALPYHDPDIVTILILSSFLLLLNLVSHILDNLIFCGLLGQVLVGVTWGTPGAKWLNVQAEEFIVKVGYLGLILLVFEGGGLSTSFRSVRANAFLSAVVATTGIGLPIALAFSLKALAKATPLQSFAAGAALCSTSLGTTFTILNTSGLTTTRLGTVLTTAAMMDDVVGLIMVQVISSLGGSNATVNSITIIRPITVSVGLVIALLLACYFLVKPATSWLYTFREKLADGSILCRVFKSSHVAFLIHTGILIGFVTGATYAGTSNLYAAYLAGASISWWDSEVGHVSFGGTKSDERQDAQGAEAITAVDPTGMMSRAAELDPRSQTHQQPQCVKSPQNPLTGKWTYDCYYLTVVDRILKPCFFASIGFSIPISQMFSGAIVWRGTVFTILMLFAKLLTGLWLVRFSIPWPKLQYATRLLRPAKWCCWGSRKWPARTPCQTSRHSKNKKAPPSSSVVPADEIPMTTLQTGQSSAPREHPVPLSNSAFASPSMEESQEAIERDAPNRIGSTTTKLEKPRSLYPAAILGSAMTARGEIGFLMASLAESKGIFTTSYSSPANREGGGGSEIYLIVVWAIVLCTVVGPLSVGTLVKRVRRLQRNDERKSTGGTDPLGKWGVI